MRSLRLFYNDRACTQGQVVIASRESQYKILHFHNGGLDKLEEIFEDWSLFAHHTDEVGILATFVMYTVVSWQFLWYGGLLYFCLNKNHIEFIKCNLPGAAGFEKTSEFSSCKDKNI